MPSIRHALPWIAASLFFALASIFELIPRSLAQTMIVVLPALMVASLNGKACALRRKGA
ncbi:hypothetical protein KNJ79_12930 [Sphingopyxis indica]|uniref:hypothetical protein n=1 Tax=Sphingopyxis indica TaxID=436663 RepID=UPI002938E9FB|nr:hypothetical protein [Sphingopyxis indica]WOF42116.1 hypothetical protein KNJ79_12930 [Sphingopyxis indica]